MTLLSAIKLSKIVAKAIQKDRDHLARLNDDYFVGRFNPLVFGLVVPDFDCKLFMIKDRELWQKKTPEGELPNPDGATLCPDKVLKFDLAVAWIPHDNGFPFIEIMAQDPAWIAAGWTEVKIQALFDGVLGDVALYHAGKMPWYHRAYAKPVARGMYAGTRIFGGIGRKIYRKFDKVQIIALVLSIFASSLSGCFSPPGIFQPSDDLPNYTIEKKVESNKTLEKIVKQLEKIEAAKKGGK